MAKSNNPVGWDQIFDLKSDKEVKEALKLLKNFPKVYDQIIKATEAMANKYTSSMTKVIKTTQALQKSSAGLNPTTAAGRKEITGLAGRADVLSASYNELKGKIVSLEGTMMKLNNEKRKVSESTRQAIKLENEEAKLKNKLTALNKSEAAEVQKLRVQIQEKNKQMKRAAQESLGLISIYQKESKQLIELRNKYKNVALQYGENSREAKRLEKQVQSLDRRLKSVDSRAGQHQRSVGQYSMAWRGLAGNLTRVAGALGFTGTIFALVSIMRNAVRTIFQFDEEMVNLAAISGQTREEIAGLENEIRRVAKTSINTATEVAKTATALKTLGKTDAEIIDLLEPVNNLSIALKAPADAAGELLVKTLNAFGESAEAGQRYADVIAKMRTSTSLDFERINDSMSFLAPTAKAVGLSIERTGALLGVLVDNGIKAARAGRLMSSSFANLVDRGITLDEALEMINSSTNRVKTASDIFGKESFTLGLILADNTDKVNEYDKAFQDAGGTLTDLTGKQLKSLSAQSKILSSTWEELVLTIESGTGAFGEFISGVIKGFTNVLMIITAAENGTIGWGEAISALADPMAMIHTMVKIQAVEAKKRADEEKRLASIKTQAEYLYQEALQNGITTFSQYEKGAAKALNQNINKTEILTELQKLFNKDNEVTARQGVITTIENQIEALKKLKKEAFTEEEIEALNIKIRAYENELEMLNKLGDAYPDIKAKGVDSIKSVRAEVDLVPKSLDKIETKSERTFSKMEVLFKRIGTFFERFGMQVADSFIGAFNALEGFIQSQEERRIESIEMRMERMEAQRERELQAVGDNEDAKFQIEQRYNMRREKMEQQIRKERTKAARREKAVRIATSIIDTAAAVVKALPNIPLSIIVGALGAAQTGLIAATPIPEYFKGTPVGGHPGGPAWISERGREIVKEPGRKPYIQDRKALLNIPRGTEVFTNRETERILTGNGHNISDVHNKSADEASKANDLAKYSAMARAIPSILDKQSDNVQEIIEGVMSKMEFHEWHFSNGRLFKNLRKGNSRHLDVKQENRYGRK